MKQIIVSGFGGQGVISLGLMCAYAAMKQGRNTSFLPSYGPEMRGGTANCSVVISEKEVASPVIGRPDILVAFNAPSVVRFFPTLAENGTVFADAETLPKEYAGRNGIVAVPLHDLSAGNPKGNNLVMFGVILACTELSVQSAEDAIHQVFGRKPQFIEANIRCLHRGIAWSKKAGYAC